MPRSVSEKTNAKNLENTHIANATIATISHFNSSNQIIEKSNLIDFESNFGSRLLAVSTAKAVEDEKIAAQTAGFKEVRAKVTKILNAAKGQGLSAESIAHLTTLVRKVRNTVTKKTPDDPATPGIDESDSKHSTANTSIAGILETVTAIVEHLKTDLIYKPNEAEFKISALEEWIAGLRDLRNNRLDAQAAAVNARGERDSYAYNKKDGLIVRMNTLKSYLETILDKSDPRYIKIKKLRFVDPTIK